MAVVAERQVLRLPLRLDSVSARRLLVFRFNVRPELGGVDLGARAKQIIIPWNSTSTWGGRARLGFQAGRVLKGSLNHHRRENFSNVAFLVTKRKDYSIWTQTIFLLICYFLLGITYSKLLDLLCFPSLPALEKDAGKRPQGSLGLSRLQVDRLVLKVLVLGCKLNNNSLRGRCWHCGLEKTGL